MATTIEVNKQSVKQLLESGKVHKFVIPEYQRSYAWTDEQVQTLFDDLVEYTSNQEESTEGTYFLGSVVSFENEKQQEIIDGQQRITTLFLLLRALYSKLSKMTETKETKNFKSQIESALWEQDELTAEVDFNKTLIISNVMGDEGNKIFANILTNGTTQSDARDNYSLNYNLLAGLIEKYATDEPELFFWFIRNVLNKAILLPITADSQDTALTIFSTLNDRGLALSDSDIFKAKIYNHLNPDEKEHFIDQWKKLDDDATNAKESIQKLFYYYMFYLRALENDRNTTTPGIRKYYSRDNYAQLYQKDIIDNLEKVLNLWLVVNSRIELEDESWSKNINIKQTLDILSSYPNEFWKYPVVIYYLKYKETEDFENLFLAFLKKLLAVLLARYIITPTINAVKRGILNLNAEIIESPAPKFDFAKVEESELKEKIKTANRNTVRMILKILAYQHQDNLLPDSWEIEHIFPQKWQSNYFLNISKQEIQELIDHIGNKIPFEKRLNIIASNGYFQKKQESYLKSKIQIVLDLAAQNVDWGPNEIREKDIRISDSLFELMIQWGFNQSELNEQDEPPVPTLEELKAIEELKRKGFI